MTEELVGTVTHYFSKPKVGVVKLTGSISVGDVVRFRGHGADFEQSVTSLQVEHAAIETAAAGTEVAVQVDQPVRDGAKVYRVTP